MDLPTMRPYNPHPQTKVTEILACSSVFIVVTFMCVPLRFYARRVAGLGFWWDDWFCLAGAPFAIIVPMIDIISSKHSMGWHLADNSEADLRRYEYLLYIVLLFYNPGLIFFKFALLAFYVRVFPVIRWLRYTAYVLGVLIIIWFLGTQFAFVFRCSPISAAWDPSGGGNCINQAHIYIAQSVPTLAFDIVILTLPVRIVWKAQLKRNQKLAVIGVFLLGGLVTIISIVRLVSTLTSTDDDITYGYVDLGIWSAAEPVIGLLACSLLTYGPLVRRVFGLNVMGSTRDKSKTDFSKRDNIREVRSNAGYSRHRDSETFELNDTEANGMPRAAAHCESTDSRDGVDIGKGGIHVRHEISVV